MLFPYHTFMIYNNWGEAFYVNGEALAFPSMFIHINWVWMMPLLFAVAGISSRYALRRRSAGEYAKERVNRLLVPLIFGLLLLIPIQAYLASLFHKGEANYLDYFTKLTDFWGTDGAFTPGQLWFILFLFVISIISLPFMLWHKKKGKDTLGDDIPLVLLLLLGLAPCIGNMLLEIGGRSPTEYLAYFLLGYFFLSNENVLEKLEKYRFLLLPITIVGYILTSIFNHICYEAVSWFAILTLLGLGRHYLDFSGKKSGYLSKSSFGVYIFHQSWLVVTAFFILKLTSNYWIQIPLIMLGTIVLTFLTYEVASRIKVVSWMFGLKGR
jgi:hypothetical protein